MRRHFISLAILLSAFSTQPAASQIQFHDITAQAGIQFVHNNGAFGKKYLPETMGPGVAFIDYDGDGWPDILLVNSEDWPGHKRTASTLKLYRNNHNGTFTDVTAKAGLALSLFGMGAAVGHGRVWVFGVWTRHASTRGGDAPEPAPLCNTVSSACASGTDISVAS